MCFFHNFTVSIRVNRFLDAYHAQNLTFWAVTTGNEPLNGIVPVNRFNSMGWTPVSHREWIGHYMGPRLRSSQHSGTLLFAIDDQRLVLPWWIKMVSLWHVHDNVPICTYTIVLVQYLTPVGSQPQPGECVSFIRACTAAPKMHHFAKLCIRF